MNAISRSFEETCAELFAGFFEQFPNDRLRSLTTEALTLVLKYRSEFPGKPAGWAGGIVYAVGCTCGCGVGDVPNADLEKAFDSSMGTIRKRAKHVEQSLPPNVLLPRVDDPEGEFTMRDEANAITAYAFRTGPIENIHADERISDPEMKELMIDASKRMEDLLRRKQDDPEKYDRFIRETIDDPHEEVALRDEANAITAYCFRAGPIENIRADGRISDPEMKELMTDASKRVEDLLRRKQDDLRQYNWFIRDVKDRLCSKWER